MAEYDWQATLDSEHAAAIADLIESALTTALGLVPSSVDKREGSIIYDAIAPTALLIELYLNELLELVEQTYGATATDAWLDARADEQGLTRVAATQSTVLGEFVRGGTAAAIEMGAMFEAQVEVTFEDGTIGAPTFLVTDTYKVDGVVQAGKYVLTCEQAGTLGNIESAVLIPASNMEDLQSAAITGVLTWAIDQEDDDALRERFYRKVRASAYGGNRAQYGEWLDSLNVDFYQLWATPNGTGGEVGIAIPADQTTLDAVKAALDPTGYTGEGAGLAPIGHSVLVAAPTNDALTLSATIQLAPGHTQEQVASNLEAALSTLLENLREQWKTYVLGDGYFCRLYRSQLVMALQAADGVAAVTNLLVGGVDQDLVVSVDTWAPHWPASLGGTFAYVS